MKHIISVLVENHFGVLAQIAGLFSGRGFNIDSLAVGETEDPARSRMTIVVQGDEGALEQALKQLNRLVEVIDVNDLTSARHVERELLLVKVASTGEKGRGGVMEIVQLFRAKVIDVQAESMTVEAAGSEEKLNALVEMLRPFGIRELVRTGRIGLARG